MLTFFQVISEVAFNKINFKINFKKGKKILADQYFLTAENPVF